MREVIVCGNQHNLHVMGMWLNFYSRWQDEVDHLRTDLTNNLHGNKLKEMILASKADYLLLCEDDGWIFKSGFVDKYFNYLEAGIYDVIGSPRFSCGQEIGRIAQQLWKIDYSGLGDKGPAFWPNFLFVRRDLLLQTDLDFFPKGWKQGESIFGETLKTDDAGDTGVWVSLQLRNLTGKILEVPQYHSSPYELDDYEHNLGVFDGNCGWIHTGSLSGDFTEPHSELEFHELERRAMWHMLCGKNMDLEITKYHLDKSRIDHLIELYRRVLWT